jgi:predicted outer membrane protein
MKKHIALAAVLAAFATPLAAQQMMAPAMVAAPMDRETFRMMAMMSDAFEMASSQMALERSRNPRIRSYAQRMVRDHSMTSAALNGGSAMYAANGMPMPGSVAGGAVGAGVGFLVGGPVGAAVGAGIGASSAASVETTGSVRAPMQTAIPLDARKSAMLNQLAAARGAQFDRLYARMQVMAHQEALGMYTAYVQTGTDPSMVAFAQSAIPHLQLHLRNAQRLRG